ncbi:MAG: hypothetical protein ACI4WS_10990, partial [Oscillospiraceae bacterium]
MSKIGKSILAVILITTLLLTVMLIYSAQRSLSTMTEDILQEEVVSFVNILKADISELVVESEYMQDMIGADPALEDVLKSCDSAGAEKIFNSYVSDDTSFAAFYGADGTEFYATDNCPPNASLSTVTDGLNCDSESMYYCFTTTVEGAGSFITGYDIRSYDYIDPIREKTG